MFWSKMIIDWLSRKETWWKTHESYYFLLIYPRNAPQEAKGTVSYTSFCEDMSARLLNAINTNFK